VPFRFFCLALTVAAFVSPPSAPAQAPQPPGSDPDLMETPLFPVEFLAVTKVNPDGTILLAPNETLPPNVRPSIGSMYAEGHYILVTHPPGPGGKSRLFRAQVIDIADGGVFTVKIGAGAAAHVREKDAALFTRPAPATTARLKALPDEIPVIDGTSGAKSALSPREAAARSQSINHLKQMGLALHNYHATFNQFPPAVIYGPDGKPWHSWRVLILPYLEQMEAYNAYDFNQPWDSPKNKKLLEKTPEVYRDPINGEAKDPYTHYAALVGPNAIFRPDGPKQSGQVKLGVGGTSLRDVTDGTSNTVVVTTVDPTRKIPWTKPEDIDVGPKFMGFGKPGGIAASYTFQGASGGKCAPFLFADGSVRVIGTSITPKLLQGLFTRAGAEILAQDSYPPEAMPSNRQKMLKIRGQGAKATATIE
jgi:prepilin-type processing-associated H-X9-DG protein